jgi:hypothetical protein
MARKTMSIPFPRECRLEPAAVMLVPDDASECQLEPGVVQAGYMRSEVGRGPFITRGVDFEVHWYLTPMMTLRMMCLSSILSKVLVCS